MKIMKMHNNYSVKQIIFSTFKNSKEVKSDFGTHNILLMLDLSEVGDGNVVNADTHISSFIASIGSFGIVS